MNYRYTQNLLLVLCCMLGMSLSTIGQTDYVPTAGATETFNPAVGDFFYDPGGPGGDCGSSGATGNYPNCGCVTTTTLTNVMEIEFLELGINGTFDFLVIYDGTSTAGTQIFHSNSDGDQLSQLSTTTWSGTTGALTFEFDASTVVNRCGWEIQITQEFVAPTCDITCPADITVPNDPGECGAFVNVPDPQITGDCMSICTGIQTVSTPLTEYNFNTFGLINTPTTLSNAPMAGCGPGDGNTVIMTAEYTGDHSSFEDFDIEFPDGTTTGNIQTNAGQCDPGVTTYNIPVADWNNWVSTYGPNLTFTLLEDGSVDDICNPTSEYQLFFEYGTSTAPYSNDYTGSGNASGFYPVGTTTVTYSTNDENGNPIECQFDVTVEDTEGPTFLNCPSGDVVFNLDGGECDVIYDYELIVEDNCISNTSGGSLTTTFAAGNQFAGNMFDLTNIGSDPIILDSFDVHIDGAAGLDADVEFYSTPDGYAGKETDASQWTLFASGTVPSAGQGNPTRFPMGGMTIQPGQTIGVYFNLANYGSGVAVDYTNGTLTVDDGTIEFDGGIGRGDPAFSGSVFSNRIWNGTVYYSGAVAPTMLEQTDNSGYTSGDNFPIGSTPQEWVATDGSGNTSVCAFNVVVNEYPDPVRSLACNDNVQISLDENCEAYVNADMILEGGPYGCYKGYIVEIATDANFNNIIASSMPGEDGAYINGAQVGDSYWVRVIDTATTNSCWGQIHVEDKLIPELECSSFTIPCAATADPGTILPGLGDEIMLTASEDTSTVTFGTAVACPTVDYSYLRVIDYEAMNISGDLPLHTFRMGVESSGGADVTIRFYRFTNPANYTAGQSNFEYADLTQIGDDIEAFIPAMNLDFWETDISGITIPQNTKWLVWEVEGPSSSSAGGWIMGSNTLGETSPTYFAASDPACAGTEPFELATLGFQGDWVSMVFGSQPGPVPFPLPEDAIVSPPSGPGPFVVSNFDPCGDVTLSFEDEIENLPCDSIYSSIIRRDWTAVDESGNTTACQDTIFVERTSLDLLALPPNYDGIDLPALLCDGNWDEGCIPGFQNNPASVDPEQENGYPDPCETGAPNSQICDNIYTTYTDQVINVCEGTYKVIRRWTFLDWCTGETLDHTQLIKVQDEEAPTFEDIPSATVSVSADPDLNCEASYDINDALILSLISDVCSPNSISYTVSTSAGQIITLPNGSLRVIGLPLGQHTLTYTADDGCGNTTTGVQIINVVDEVAPVAICDQNTKVALGQDGTARVYWQTIEDGSYDNCGIDRIEVRRMNPSPNACEVGADDNFKPYVEFCCEDLLVDSVVILFRVTDESGNQNTCMVTVRVEDKLRPVIVPPANLTLSCTYDFDIWYLEDRNNRTFGGVADFTKGETRQVTDIYDRSLEVECLGAVSGREYDENPYPSYELLDGYADDNCSIDTIEIRIVDERNNCGVGNLIREFIVRDLDGNQTPENPNNPFTKIVQVITFVDCDPFTSDDIIWPRQYDGKTPSTPILTCEDLASDSTSADPTPQGTGVPTFRGDSDDRCATPAIRYEDEVFDVVPDACYKIFRHWEVIDWCTFDSDPSQPWTYTQVIKVKDTEAPVLGVCDDITICDSAATDCLGAVTLNQTVADCTPDEFLKAGFRIDPFNDDNDPTDDIVVDGLTVTDGEVNWNGTLPFGTHKITWIVEDMCGQVGTCEYLITVEDCKLPTPYCLNGIATVVMPVNGMIEIWASDFDAGSFDNCGGIAHFSFSSDTTDKSRAYTCDSLENGDNTTFEVEIWVTDEAGNQDFCRTYVQIQDNMDVCPPDSATIVSGTIATSAQQGVSGAEVRLQSMSAPTPMVRTTDDQGQFLFGAQKNTDYELSANKNDDVLNGVSTWDIALIQQHILGLNTFTDPYLLIAANVDDNDKISGSDLIDLRKVILGIEDEFPSNDSWRFVDKAETLPSGVLPRGYAEVITLMNVVTDKPNQDFTAVKIGDLDGSADPNGLTDGRVEGRSAALVMTAEDAVAEEGEELRLEVTSEMFREVMGYQWTMGYAASSMDFVTAEAGALEIGTNNIGVFADRGQLTMSWNDVEAQSVKAGEVLFTLVFKATEDVRLSEAVNISSDITKAEAYVDGDVTDVDLRFTQTSAEFALYQNVPNPFEGRTVIGFNLPVESEAVLTVYDVTGKVLKVIESDYAKGYNQVSINRNELNASGVVYYQLEAGDYTATKKMVIIE